MEPHTAMYNDPCCLTEVFAQSHCSPPQELFNFSQEPTQTNVLRFCTSTESRHTPRSHEKHLPTCATCALPTGGSLLCIVQFRHKKEVYGYCGLGMTFAKNNACGEKRWGTSVA